VSVCDEGGTRVGNVCAVTISPKVVPWRCKRPPARRVGALVGAVFALVAVAPLTFAQRASFQGLGDLPGGAFDSLARAISGDGAVVVGHGATADGYEAFRWTQGEGMVPMGNLPDADPDLLSSALAASADGSVIVGVGKWWPSWEGEAFRWTAAEGMVGLGDLPGGDFFSVAYDLTPDGSVIVGNGNNDATPSGKEAFRWTEAEGMVGLGDLSPDHWGSRARAISADGSVIVGDSETVDHFEAWRWTESDGMVSLGDLPGGDVWSRAFDVSGDGSVIVGFGNPAPSVLQAWRWTEAEGMVQLPDFPSGGVQAIAQAITPDGSIIVGSGSIYDGGAYYSEAAIWDDMHGIRSVKDVLVDLGVDLTGWRLLTVTGVSNDGQTLGGVGWNPTGGWEAWVASIDEAIPGDIDGDGDVDLADLAALLAVYGLCAGDPGYIPEADLDSSGCITLSDLAGLLANYGN